MTALQYRMWGEQIISWNPYKTGLIINNIYKGWGSDFDEQHCSIEWVSKFTSCNPYKTGITIYSTVLVYKGWGSDLDDYEQHCNIECEVNKVISCNTGILII